MSENELTSAELEALSVELERLIGQYQSLKAYTNVDKKWLNKVVSRLQEVQLFGTQLRKGPPITKAELNGYVDKFNNTAGCTCPMPGVLDVNCPAHGGNK